MSLIKKYSGHSLSRFRTQNSAEYFIEAKKPEDAVFAFDYAAANRLNAFVLGGGSNVFFKNRKIKSLIIKNALPQTIENLGDGVYKVSSSVKMTAFLKTALKDSRDCFYYLASAPCEIGGAVAMNAGSGPKEGKSISDFLTEVEVLRGGKIETLKRDSIKFAYRSSPFSKDAFIISATFRLPPLNRGGNPIAERLAWARENQDLTAPNCGSLCGKYDAGILKFTRLIFSPLNAGLSPKKLNWAYNRAKNPFVLRLCLETIAILHKLLRKNLKFEIKIVE